MIRGDDHISNTPKQISLYRAFGLAPPRFAHIPLILDPGGAKISKRKEYDFPVTIEQTKEMGYLPEAFVNFLALLGWSPGNDIELMTMEEMIGHFTLDRCGTTPARFLRDKLDWMNGLYIRKSPIDRIVELCRPYLAQAYDLGGVPEDRMREAVRQRRERLKRIQEIVGLTRFYFHPELTYDEKAVAKWLKAEGAAALLRELRAEIATMASLEPGTIEEMLKRTSEKHGLKMGKVAQPLRVAVTGGDASPPMDETLALLGRERVLSRIDAALAMLS